MTAVLEADNVTRQLPGVVPVTLVNGISLTLERGEFVTIVGPSGSGKSSLLYLLGLLDAPTSGRIILDGVDTSTLNEERLGQLRLEKLGFVFQFHFLLGEFTAAENVMLPMKKLGHLSDAEQMSRAEELLADLELSAQVKKRPGQMSGGQRQRVALARAMANDPLLIMADEPTGNLDSRSSKNVREILSDLAHRRHKTIVAVTHDPEFARAGDRVVHLVDGRLVD